MKPLILGLLFLLCAGCAQRRVDISSQSHREGATLSLAPGGSAAAVYNLRSPEGSSLPMVTAGYFHPVYTPTGELLTDFAPSDHPHHRGIFLAWVEMHGARSADFWGWGEHAPIKGREIRNVSMKNISQTKNSAAFEAENIWLADEMPLIQEHLTARTERAAEGTVLDLAYRLTPLAHLTVEQWAFSGFCLRIRKDGEVKIYSPQGLVGLPNPIHTKPESDWPDAKWYAAEIKLPNGKVCGGAVLSHPENPATLWHNHRDTRMINPCVTAAGPLALQKGKVLALRYRVVAFDGPPPVLFLNSLAREWD